jgi:YD repeat-containing protein
VRADGTVWAWGYNAYGQLGDGTTTPRRSTPIQVPGLSGITAVSGSRYHSLALRNDGTVWAWGYNGTGQLGDGTSTSRYSPVQVQGLSGITAIAAGGYHSLALRNDGSVWAWGYNAYGQLGDTTYFDQLAPVRVYRYTAQGIKALAAGLYHSMALRDDGTVWAWGYNIAGQLGHQNIDKDAYPGQVPGLTSIKSIASRGEYALAVRGDGTLWSWGYDAYGQRGDGDTAAGPAPQQVKNLANVAHIGAGDITALAVRGDGTLWSWGANHHGQLGTGQFLRVRQTEPTQAQGFTGITALAAGANHAVALRNNGTVWVWGSNSHDELGDGFSSLHATPGLVSWP